MILCHTMVLFDWSECDITPWSSDTANATPNEAPTSTSSSSDSIALSSTSSDSFIDSKLDNIPKLLGLKVSKNTIEDLVRCWGPVVVELYRDDFALATTTDPLASLWTAENWRLWLDAQAFVIWLVKRRQLAEYGPRGLAADLMPDMLGEVLGCDPMMFLLDLAGGSEGEEECFAGCAWRDCEWHCKDPGPEAGVRFWACKGCREVRYCGRECHRNDWSKGGHKAHCKRLKGSERV